MKFEFVQPRFSEGVLAKSLQGRSSEEFYKYGLKGAKNMLPILSGPVVKRPGTNYIGVIKDLSAIFIPFFKDKNNTYILEIGQLHSQSADGFTLTCTTSNTSATVTAASTTGLVVGLSVSGTGIQSGSTIVSIIEKYIFCYIKSCKCKWIDYSYI